MMWIITMSSESREWTAMGRTEEEAKQTILNAWNEEQKTLEDRGWDAYYYETFEELDDYYGTRISVLVPGECEIV